jgi:hypothetical protein
MEKYAVENDDLAGDLRNEEHTLMAEMSRYMSGFKSAEEGDAMARTQNRLQAVRDKITEIDLGRKKQQVPLV